MTRKDFQLIADVVKESKLSLQEKQAMALAFAEKLYLTNPSFDKARFVKACLDE